MTIFTKLIWNQVVCSDDCREKARKARARKARERKRVALSLEEDKEQEE